MITNFKSYSQYYDLLYQDKDYKAEAAYVSGHIRSLLPGARTLLELGCGTGNHARHLCQMGYDITGVERSAEMVAQAAAKQIKNFTPVIADFTQLHLGLKFDAAISLFHSLCYITDNNALLDCFKQVCRHLHPGGVFAFDLWYAPAVIHNMPSSRIKRQQNEQVEVIRLAEPRTLINKNIVEVNYNLIIKDKATGSYTSLSEQHPMRYFTIPEIEMIATCTGFNVLLAREFMGAGDPAINSWNVLMVLQKKHDA